MVENGHSPPLAQASSAQSLSRWPKEERSAAEAWPRSMAILARTWRTGDVGRPICPVIIYMYMYIISIHIYMYDIYNAISMIIYRISI